MKPLLGSISAHHTVSSQAESLCYLAVAPLICQLFCNLRFTLLKYRKQPLYLKKNAKLGSPLSTGCLNTKYKMSRARWQSPQSTCEISQGGNISLGYWVPLTKEERQRRTGTSDMLHKEVPPLSLKHRKLHPLVNNTCIAPYKISIRAGFGSLCLVLNNLVPPGLPGR